MAKRKIVKIDEEKCTGCGICIPSCVEGALQIIDGKARLMKEIYCDGLGACLGDCPEGAISIEERDADEFDEKAVEEYLKHQQAPVSSPSPPASSSCSGGCPGTMLQDLRSPDTAAAPPMPVGTGSAQSRLGQWPVQIHLLPPVGPLWDNADVLVAADCVAFAMPDFHEKLLVGKTVAIGCPKLDDIKAYTDKFTDIFSSNAIRSVTVAHMEVPCCSGLVFAMKSALATANKGDIEFHDILISLKGKILSES